MSTYTQQLAKRIREQNEIRDIYKERAQEAQTSYDTAVNTLKSGGDVYSLDDSARTMYRNIQSELAKQQREEQERLKKEREQMSGIERFGHTLGDFFGQSIGGMGKFLENTVDYFGTMFGADEDWVKRDWTQELYMDKLREGTKGSYLNDGKFGNMVQSSMFGLGNMLPSLALNAVPYVGGALSLGSHIVNAAGGSTERALQEGATRNKALLYGTLSGISEGAIEKISGGIGGVGKGIVQSVGKSAGKSAVAKGVLGTAKKYTGRMIGEGLEEVASDVIDPLLRATYTGKVDYSDMTAGSLAETFGVGAMTSGLMLGGQAMAHNATAANRVRTKLGELNEVKAALDKRYYDGKLTEAQYKQGLSDINWLAEKTIKTMNRVSDRKAEKIVDKVGEKRLENAGIMQANGKFNVNQPNVGAYNYKAMTPSLANKVDSLAYQPTSAELTPEQESLVKDYGKINNGKASIVFTDDIGAVTEDGSKLSANGAYSDGVIYISRTAENPLREVMKHEFTHALEGTKAYGKFADFVIGEIQKSPVLQKEYGDFAKTFIETAEQYQGVTADDRAIVSEIVAKYSERLFSDPKAINRLARANKGLAMKVLGMVTDRLSVLGKGKGTAEMRKFLRRAEGLYRKAITAKPSRGIALNGNTANEKDTTADINENSNTENTANIADSTENRSNIETNSQNIDENSNISDGNIKKVISKNGQIVQYDIQKSFSEQIDDALNGELNQNQFIYVGKPSSIMLENGFGNYDIVMSNNVLKKLQEKHGLSISTIKELNTAINNPIYILESNTVENAKVIVTDLKDAESRPIIVAIHLDVNTKIGIVNILASAYGRNSFANFLNRARSEEKILYENKEKAQVYLQGATIAQSDITRASNNSISNSDTNVNNSATESLKNDEKASNIDENSNIADGKPKIQYAIKNVDKSKIDFKENENAVKGMKPVTSIKRNVFQKGNTKLTDMAAQYFNSLGNNVFNAELGDIELNKMGIKDSMAHGIGALKAAAFKAVPRVIEKGKILDYQENWKSRGKDTVVLSAPILIDGLKHYIGVVLLRDYSRDMQRFYLHEISLNKKEVNPFKTAAAAGRTNSERSGLTSNNSISNSETNVNNSATESLKNDEKASNIDANSNSDIKFSLKESVEKDVLDYYGNTYRWTETGYIFKDGTRLDMSGRKDGASGGYRTVDHRDIFDIYKDSNISGTDAMVEFMGRGNIRVNPESPGINIQIAPTEEQYKQIQSLVENLGWKSKEFTVDFDNAVGDNIDTLYYEGNVSARKVISDIRYFFKEGKIPYQSDLAKFRYSLKANKAQLSEEITLTAEQMESVDKALKAIDNKDIARSHIENAIKSLRIEIDGKTYRVVYNDKYYDVSIDMLTKALEGVKNNSLVDLNTLAKHIINAVELYDESAYKLLKGHSKTELNKISKLLSNAKRNKIRLSGSLITANNTQIVNEYCSVDGVVTLTSLVNQLKEMGVTIKGRTLINKLQNLDKLYDTVSNSKNGLKLADIAPKKVSLQQRVIANRIIKSIDKTGAMTAIIDSVRNVEKAKAKMLEENAKADANVNKTVTGSLKRVGLILIGNG